MQARKIPDFSEAEPALLGVAGEFRMTISVTRVLASDMS